MKKNLKYLLVGIYFGIVLVKSEVVSWFRIQEMFRFQGFHMYGVIGMAVIVGAISLFIIKKRHMKSVEGENMRMKPKRFHTGLVIGGLLFGLGWAFTGACPGPIYAIIGSGTTVFLIVILSAISGVWFYGLIRKKLPH